MQARIFADADALGSRATSLPNLVLGKQSMFHSQTSSPVNSRNEGFPLPQLGQVLRLLIMDCRLPAWSSWHVIGCGALPGLTQASRLQCSQEEQPDGVRTQPATTTTAALLPVQPKLWSWLLLSGQQAAQSVGLQNAHSIKAHGLPDAPALCRAVVSSAGCPSASAWRCTSAL